MTLEQFHAIYAVAPHWLRWLMTLAFHLALRRIDLVNLRFDDLVGDRIVSAIRKTDSKARGIEATSVDFPIHPDVRRVLIEARRSSLRLGRCPFIVHREPQRQTGRAKNAFASGRMEHPAQVLPEYASKAFYKARDLARQQTGLFAGLSAREMPTVHEIRALSSHLYAKAHARKVLRVDMMLPFSVPGSDDGVRESRPGYMLKPKIRQEIFPENFLTKNPISA